MGNITWLRLSLLISILIAVLALIYFKVIPHYQPSKTPPLASSEKIAVKQHSLQELPDVSLKNSFVSVVPIKFRVEKYREIPLPEGDASDPAVSPDGHEIAFLLTSTSDTKIAIVNLATNDIAPLSLGLDGYGKPSWSPDGSKITFSGDKGGVLELYVYDTKSQKLSQITNDPKKRKFHPVYGPYPFDEHYRISYVSEEEGRKDIYWVRESGEDDRPITFSPTRLLQYKKPEMWNEYDNGIPQNLIETCGDLPEWSPSA